MAQRPAGRAGRSAQTFAGVHGAWADGSSWAEVIPRLQAAGLKVTSVQNPLTSLADSVAATRRVLRDARWPDCASRPHPGADTVISETGTDPKVTALVYVAARAPDTGEDFVALSGKYSCRASTGRHPATRWFHHNFGGGLSSIFRERCRPHESRSALCRTGADGRLSIRRTNHSGCLALQTVMVCGFCRNSIRQSIPTWNGSGKTH